MILTIRTDKPEAEVGLYDQTAQIRYLVWQAHRELAETIHERIKEMLAQAGQGLSDVTGIVVYHGPGSFTGLRIGVAVANALADSLRVPIVGSGGDVWIEDGIASLGAGSDVHVIQPFYGSEPHITTQKK